MGWTLLLCAMLGQGPAEADLRPVPSLTELVEGRRLVDEVFGPRIEAAKTAPQKAAVAEEILRVAEKEPHPANRYAGYQVARRLAVEADCGRVGLAVVTRLAAEFQPTLPRQPDAWLPAADKAWDDAEQKKGTDRLAGRLDAAECFLRAEEAIQAGFAAVKWNERLSDLAAGDAPAVAGKARPPLKLSARAMRMIHSLDGATVAFVNRANGLAINVAGRNKEPGARVIQWPLPDARESHSYWVVKVLEDGYCRFRNQLSRGWLTMIDEDGVNRATQGVAHETANDWEVRPLSGGLVLLIHADSGLCLGPFDRRNEQNQLIVGHEQELSAAHLLWGIRLISAP